MLLYIVWRSFQYCGQIVIKLNQLYILQFEICFSYIQQNVTLHCLKVFPVLRSNCDQIKSTLYSSVRNMFQLHSAKSPINPSFFLKSLKDAFIREGRSYDLHAQQDVVKVLEILLEELTSPFIIISVAYNIKSITSTICHTCH